MVFSLDEVLVPWDISQWSADKQKAAISVTSHATNAQDPSPHESLKGLLLTHADPQKIYLAPDPEKLAFVIELTKSDIADAEVVPGELFEYSGNRRSPLMLITLIPTAVAFPVLAVPKARLPGLIDGMSGSNPKEPPGPKEPTCPTGVRGGIRL